MCQRLTWFTVRGKVMELLSTGVRLLTPLSTMFWSSAAFDSFARRAEMACASQIDSQRYAAAWLPGCLAKH